MYPDKFFDKIVNDLNLILKTKPIILLRITKQIFSITPT